MKKIISLILTLVLVFTAVAAFSSCNKMDKDTETQMRNINAMFETLVPSQSVTTVTQDMGALVLTSVATLTMGTVDGNKAATYVNEYEELAPLDGSNNANLIQKKTQILWYVEGRGLCKNANGKWIADGEDFRPEAGDIKLYLTANMLTSAEYDAATGTFTAVLDKNNANKLLADFLGEEQRIASGLTLVICTAGGRVSSLKLEYVEPAEDLYIGEGDELDASEEDLENNTISIPESVVTIEIHYSYDAKVITLN